MKQSILQRIRVTYLMLLIFVCAGLVVVGMYGLTGREETSNARDRHAQSFYSLADALSILQEATARGSLVMTSKVPADVKEYLVDHQQYLTSFDRAIEMSLKVHPTSERRRKLETIKDGFAAYLTAIRKFVEGDAVDPGFVQHLKEKHKHLVTTLHAELDEEREATERSLGMAERQFGLIQNSLIGGGGVFSLLCVLSYGAFFHNPLKRETARFALHVETLKKSHNASDARRLESSSLNVLGDAYQCVKEIVRRARNSATQAAGLVHKAHNTLAAVSDLATTEGLKHRSMTDLMEKEFEARQRRQQKVNELSTTVAETSQAVASIKKRMDALKESILRISTSADENLHQLSSIDKQTTEVSDSTTGIRKSIQAISNEIKGMSENAAERFRLLTELEKLLVALGENVTQAKAKNDEIGQRADNRGQLLERTKSQALATKKDLDAISDSMKTVEGKIAELEEKIKHTDEVIDKVNEIARKTNILALNAQVEAAKAKEGGEGFKVIADEIKLLAGTATESTNPIGAVFDEIRESIKAVKEAMQEEKEKILTSQSQSAGTIEGLEGIHALFNESALLRAQVKNSIDLAVGQNNEAAALATNVLHKSSEVTASLNAQTEQLETINIEIQDLDQITTHVSDGTAEVRKVIETQIVDSIKRISNEISEIGEAIAQQDVATDLADEAIKDIKAEYEKAAEYEAGVREAKRELDKLFAQENDQLKYLGKICAQVYKIHEEQTSLLAAPEVASLQASSGMELHV